MVRDQVHKIELSNAEPRRPMLLLMQSFHVVALKPKIQSIFLGTMVQAIMASPSLHTPFVLVQPMVLAKRNIELMATMEHSLAKPFR